MISFKQFINGSSLALNESRHSFPLEEAIHYIKAHCQRFIRESHGMPLFRGISEIPNECFYTPQPQDRLPRDSSKGLNLIMDIGFKNAFGQLDVRKSAYFCSGSEVFAHDYGQLFYVFPHSNYSYLWSREILDVFVDKARIFVMMFNKVYDDMPGAFPRAYFSSSAMAGMFEKAAASMKSLGDGSLELFSKYFIDAYNKHLEWYRKELDIEQFELTEEDTKRIEVLLGELFKELYTLNDRLDDAAHAQGEIMFFEGNGYIIIPEEMLNNYLEEKSLTYKEWTEGL